MFDLLVDASGMMCLEATYPSSCSSRSSGDIIPDWRIQISRIVLSVPIVEMFGQFAIS